MLNLTQVEAGEIFGVTIKTSNRWANGKTPVPWATATMLDLMVHKQIKVELYFVRRNERWVWRLQAEPTVYSLADKTVRAPADVAPSRA
jgi:hypothetical protein